MDALANGTNIGSIFNDGNFHIESTTNTTLWLNGDNSAPVNIAQGGGYVYFRGGSDYIDSSNNLIWNAGGKVGIGTTVPNAPLEVVGSGGITFNNNVASYGVWAAL